MVQEITPVELKSMLDRNEQLFLLDVREPFEREICQIGGELIPTGELEQNLSRIPKDKKVVVYCHAGGRSQRVVELLQSRFGYTNIFNLNGGVLRWAEDVDPAMPRY